MKNMSPTLTQNIESKLARNVSWGAAIISMSAFTSLATGFVPTLLTIEIATTALAILVAIACLLYIYQEHHAWTKRELKYKKDFINQIYSNHDLLPPRKIIIHHVDLLLEAQNTPEQRLNILRFYRRHPKAIATFLTRLRQQHAELEMLQDLGLCWGSQSKSFRL